MRRPASWLITAFTLVLPALGDQVDLQNGDRLSGQVKSLTGGKLVLETDYAGELTIDWSQVKSLRTEQEYLVTLLDGADPVAGPLQPGQEGRVEIGTEEVQEVPLEEIVRIEPKPVPGEKPGIFDRWHGHVDLGYSITRGNTDLNNLAFTVQPERETPRDRIGVLFQSIYSVQDGITSSNLHRARIRYDRFLGDQTFYFILLAAKQDERELLDLRTRQGAGFGIKFSPLAQTQLSLFGGVTFLQEKFRTGSREFGSEGLAGVELETQLLPSLVLTTKSQLTPILAEDRFLFEWDANLRFPLVAGLTFGIQLFDNYDSRPRPGIKKNDVGLLSTLGFKF